MATTGSCQREVELAAEEVTKHEDASADASHGLVEPAVGIVDVQVSGARRNPDVLSDIVDGHEFWVVGECSPDWRRCPCGEGAVLGGRRLVGSGVEQVQLGRPKTFHGRTCGAPDQRIGTASAGISASQQRWPLGVGGSRSGVGEVVHLHRRHHSEVCKHLQLCLTFLLSDTSGEGKKAARLSGHSGGWQTWLVGSGDRDRRDQGESVGVRLPVAELASRIDNALALGALGDSVGSGVEGVPLEERARALFAGPLTDDSILTFATASAIADAGRVDPEAIADRFVSAFSAGIPGMGSSTLGALQALRAGQHWGLSGISGDRAAGNGAAMRIAPVAFVVDPMDSDGRQAIRDVARITHRNDEASTGAIAFAIGLRIALRGCRSVTDGLGEVAAALPDTRVRDAIVAASELGGASIASAVAALGSSGFVAESVPLALYIGLSPWASPMDPVAEAARLSEDSDTVASMVGQLLGASGHVLGAGDRPIFPPGVDPPRLGQRLATLALSL